MGWAAAGLLALAVDGLPVGTGGGARARSSRWSKLRVTFIGRMQFGRIVVTEVVWIAT